METFAAKVRYGYGCGSRFDPIMEERGGWIAGEAQKHDTEMTNVVIEVMAEVSQHIKEELNPFKEKVGDPFVKSGKELSGFLVRKDANSIKINSQKLLVCIDVPKDQFLIAKFVGPKLPLNTMRSWLKTLNQELRGGGHIVFVP